jgi:cephalosporin-C deacetylase-like acetyl esterase
MNKLYLAVFLFLLYFPVEAQTELNVLKGNWLEYSDAPNALYNHLTRQAFDLLDIRSDKIRELNTLSDWQNRQDFIRKTLMDIVGPFPEKTPLKPKIVRSIDKGSYRVEHIMFESQPGFIVTSSLYIPSGLKKSSKLPVIIYCSGHTAEGYRSTVYQHIILNLVNKGFIVFAFDPVGQGERLEYPDPKTGKSSLGGPTREHSYPGAQAFITGSSQARYMIWDGIRAVDYLMTRKEVDPARIGITGRSGGGTQSAYIAAFDDRIYAAAPENYITNYKRLLQTIGPQDAEQNMFNIISRGLDHPDFLTVRAPKPAMMITTSGDMFSIQGAIETEKEVSLVYKILGREDNFSRVEDDAAHASTKKNREAMYAFFQKHLANPGDPADRDFQPLTADELRVTLTGQVSTSPGSETVFSLNKKETTLIEAEMTQARSNPNTFLPAAIKSAKQLSGYIEPESPGNPVLSGRVLRDKYSVEKYFIQGEGNYVIPFLLFKPASAGKDVMIYLHPDGKNSESGIGGEIEKFVNKGITVIAPDLIGTGEMGSAAIRGDATFDGASHNMWYASMIIGRSITGIRIGDLMRIIQWIDSYIPDAEITGFASGEMVSLLLHTSSITKKIRNIVLNTPYTSFMSIVKSRFYKPSYILTTVPGAIGKYDLPDLAASLAPRKLLIINPVDAMGTTNDTDQVLLDLDVIKSGFNESSSNEKLKIVFCLDEDYYFYQIMEWVFNQKSVI